MADQWRRQFPGPGNRVGQPPPRNTRTNRAPARDETERLMQLEEQQLMQAAQSARLHAEELRRRRLLRFGGGGNSGRAGAQGQRAQQM